jgi:hypothetical protein
VQVRFGSRQVAGSIPVSPAKTPEQLKFRSFYFVLKLSCWINIGYGVPIKTENRQRLYAYLSEHPCVDCGETDVRVLEFDHVRDNKSANIAGLLNNAVSWSTIEKEIAKCDVRCANCHRIKTNERGRTKISPQLCVNVYATCCSIISQSLYVALLYHLVWHAIRC